MNNEPVAWILNGIIHEFDPSDWAKEQYPDQDVIPLYTQKNTRLHPFKTLTDEEILQLWGQKNNLNGAQDIIDFARAILRKAQE